MNSLKPVMGAAQATQTFLAPSTVQLEQWKGTGPGLGRKGFRESTRKLEGDIFNYDKKRVAGR